MLRCEQVNKFLQQLLQAKYRVKNFWADFLRGGKTGKEPLIILKTLNLNELFRIFSERLTDCPFCQKTEFFLLFERCCCFPDNTIFQIVKNFRKIFS